MLGTIKKIHETSIISPECTYLPAFWPEEIGAPLQELGVHYGALTTFKPPYKLIRGNNEKLSYFYLFVVKGILELETEQGDYLLSPGSMVAMPTSLNRRLELIEGEYQELYFSIKDSSNVDLLKVDRLYVRESIEIEKLANAFKGYFSELENAMAVDCARIHYEELIATLLKREALALKEGIYDEVKVRFTKLIFEIQQNLSFKWTVEEMASRLFVSAAHLYRLSQKYYCMTPMELVDKQRLEQAKKMLINTDLKLEVIAMHTGYASPYGFSNAFMRYTGMRPGAYRKLKSK